MNQLELVGVGAGVQPQEAGSRTRASADSGKSKAGGRGEPGPGNRPAGESLRGNSSAANATLGLATRPLDSQRPYVPRPPGYIRAAVARRRSTAPRTGWQAENYARHILRELRRNDPGGPGWPEDAWPLEDAA